MSCGRSIARATAMWRWCAAWYAWRSWPSWWWPVRSLPRPGCSARHRRASCRRRTKAQSSPPCVFLKARRFPAPRRWSGKSKTSCGRYRACKGSCQWWGSISSTTSPHRTRRSSSSDSNHTRSAPGQQRAPARSSRGCVRRWRRSRAPLHSHSTCRRYSDSGIPAASNMHSRRYRANHPSMSRLHCAAWW